MTFVRKVQPCSEERKEVIKANYENLLHEIEVTCDEADIPADKRPKLLVISKTWPDSEVQALIDLGVQHFGENRVQELTKRLKVFPSVDWQMVGNLQRNKVKMLLRNVSLIHSINSWCLLRTVNELALENAVVQPVLIEVNTSQEPSKYGFDPRDLLRDLGDLAKFPGISFHGLMTMAPLTEDEEVIRKSFRDLRELKDKILEANVLREPEKFTELSMGMSHDYKIAIQEGATILRIGTQIFGGRPSTQEAEEEAAQEASQEASQEDC